MPRRSKGPRLYWRERRDGRASWYIFDGKSRIPTGTASSEEAEKALSLYIQEKYRPGGPAGAHELTIGEALSLYAEGRGGDLAAPERAGYAIEALAGFWGHLPISTINGATCRRYAAERGVSPGTVRRELGVLQAATNWCAREGYLTSAPIVTLPEKPAPRERWLTRQEAAWLLRAARTLNSDGRHLADFILHGLYTGSRKATILSTHIDHRSAVGGTVDTVQGVLYRRPLSKAATKKRQTPARIPKRYLAQLRRQAKNGRRYVVERKVVVKGVEHRAMVKDIRKAWSRAVDLATAMAVKRGVNLDLTLDTPQGKKPITPHVLRHTAITWALQRGATIWDVSGYFGVSPETIERVYGHHSPDHQATAVDAMNRSW